MINPFYSGTWCLINLLAIAFQSWSTTACTAVVGKGMWLKFWLQKNLTESGHVICRDTNLNQTMRKNSPLHLICKTKFLRVASQNSPRIRPKRRLHSQVISTKTHCSAQCSIRDRPCMTSTATHVITTPVFWHVSTAVYQTTLLAGVVWFPSFS